MRSPSGVKRARSSWAARVCRGVGCRAGALLCDQSRLRWHETQCQYLYCGNFTVWPRHLMPVNHIVWVLCAAGNWLCDQSHLCWQSTVPVLHRRQITMWCVCRALLDHFPGIILISSPVCLQPLAPTSSDAAGTRRLRLTWFARLRRV